jgi:cytochrome c oxidase cbb3-type subunit III
MKKILIVSFILIFIIIGVISQISNRSSTDEKDQVAIAAGERVYNNQQCASCHGVTGKGEGAKAGTSLNNQHFLNSINDEDLFNHIKFGREGTFMPAYPSLSTKEIKSLVAFIRNWQIESLDLDAPKTISGNPENGKKIYDLYCLSCHGIDGVGKLKMGTALSNPQYLKYTSDQQIWVATAYGREDTRMGPSLKGLEGARQLSKAEITNVVTYIRTLESK